MAKQHEKKASDLLSRLLEKHDPKGSIIEEYTPIDDANVKFAPTGNYMLNAHFSGSILKGAPMGKIVTICGEPKAGKSFVLLNIAREVQKVGYLPFILETEFSHDKNRFVLQGIDISKARISQPTTVEELITIVNPIVSEFMKVYDAIVATKEKTEGEHASRIEAEIPKICFFLDSRSGLLSKQQLDSFADGAPKANMGTDIQTYDNFMKSIAINLGKLGWGFIVTSHTKIEEVKMQGRSFTKRRPKGGFGQIFMSSTISMLWKKDERDEEDKSQITGIRVTVDVFESRYVKHRPISFSLPNDRPMNPLDGLLEYVNWDTCKIGKGKWIEVLDIRAKLIAKKVITAESTVITGEHLKTLSKADAEYIDPMIHYLTAERGFLNKIDNGWEITKKYMNKTDDILMGQFPVSNPTSPKFIAANLPNEYFTEEQLIEVNADGDSRIFTKSVLEMIDVFVRADFEIGSKSLETKAADGKDKDDYFA